VEINEDTEFAESAERMMHRLILIPELLKEKSEVTTR